MHIRWICLLLVVSYTKGTLHPESPCPSVFSYEGTEPEQDRWFGIVLLSTDESLVGVRLDIKLDRPTQILVSWLGEVTTEDNERFTILSLSQKLHPGPPLSSRFMVKFNTTQGSPQVRTIRLNGRQICPPDLNFPTDIQNYQTISLRNHDTTERSTRRPDPDFEDNRGPASTTESTRRTTKHYISEDNPPKQVNNNFYHENTVTHATTKRYYNSETDYQSRPNIHDINERFSTTEKYNNIEAERPVYNNYNLQRTTHKPYYEESNDDQQLSSTPRYNVEDVRPGSDTKTTFKPNYMNTYEGSNEDERFSTTKRYKNIKDDTPEYNTYNQQKTTPKPNYKIENEGNNNRFSTTERYHNVEDDRPEPGNHNQETTTRNLVTNSNSHITPKPLADNKASTTIHHAIDNNQPPKSDIGSQELHLSTNYQINTGQSNKFPSISAKNKNDTSNMKGANSKLSGKDSPSTKYHKSESDGRDTPGTSMECGKVAVPPAPLITNGQDTARGQWPWHIALYKIEGINLSYICGGSLVSSTAVVTAAHCVTKSASGRPVDADILVVYLGKYHLYQFSDDGGVQNKQVRDVHVHPQYNQTNFHNDIAVLTLTSPVEYTTYVRPVCLWNGDDTDLNTVEGKEGTVVGWGYDENDEVTEELKMAHMPVVSQQTCIWSYPQFFSQFTSNKTFCAGFRKGTSVCNGDSGGGMVFSKGSLWYLRGLVSITVARQGLKVCDTNHYVVFTDAAKYSDWISQYIS